MKAQQRRIPRIRELGRNKLLPDSIVDKWQRSPLTIMPSGQNSLAVLVKCFRKNIVWKISEEKLLIGTLPTNLLHMFCKIILDFQVIVKSIETTFSRVLWKMSCTLIQCRHLIPALNAWAARA